jgi:hypothetical protein
VIELLLVLLVGNIVTNVKIANFNCNSDYVGDQSDGDIGILYMCNYAKRMEHSKEGVLERSDTSNIESNR